MKKNFYWFACFACATVALAFSSCNDDKIEPDIEVPTEVTGVYILNGGDYGGNNAGISYLDSEGKVTEDIFKKQNNRALGDMGQHMINMVRNYMYRCMARKLLKSWMQQMPQV